MMTHEFSAIDDGRSGTGGMVGMGNGAAAAHEDRQQHGQKHEAVQQAERDRQNHLKVNTEGELFIGLLENHSIHLPLILKGPIL